MDSSRRAILGAFIVGGVLLFALGLFWIGDRRMLFADNIVLETNFMNVSGLARGGAVRVAGADAGEILSVIVPSRAGDPFRVRFRVTANLQPILREDSVATIQTDGLVGNKFLQVAAGTPDAPPAAPGSTIGSREPIEVGDLMERMNELAISGNEAVDDVRMGITRTVDTMTELGSETTGVIQRLGGEIESITSTADDIATNINLMLDGVRSGQGTVGRLLTDESLYSDLRTAANEVQEAVANMRAVSDDFRAVSTDLRGLELSQWVDRVGANVEALTAEAAEFTDRATAALESFQGTSGPGGLMADVRRTLDNTNRAMANMVDNTEALKRNWFFRGFFNDRGFFSIDAVSLGEYLDNRFLADRQRITRRLAAEAMFDSMGMLTDVGRQRLDTVMAEFIRYSREDPLMIETYTAGPDPGDLLLARDWAVTVRDYLISRFELGPSYVGIMPMSVSDLAPEDRTGDGVALVLFATRGR